jgi:hypothetical protein
VTDGRYSFKVLAQNIVGLSDFSDALLIVAAVIPSQPGTPYKNYASISAIEIRWTEPLSNAGSNVTDYRVWWDEGKGTDEFVYIDSTEGYLTYTIDA